jgi:hypothetical protein
MSAMHTLTRRSAVAIGAAGLLCLTAMGGGASALTAKKGITGSPQPELKPFTIGTDATAGTVAILANGSLVVAYGVPTKNDEGAVEVCVIARGGTSCTHSVKLTTLSGDGIGDVSQVFALPGDKVIVLENTCCDASPDGGDLMWTSTDGGVVFGAPVRVGSVDLGAAEVVGDNIVFTGGNAHIGAQVESISTTAVGPPANTAVVNGSEPPEVGIGNYKGGVLAANDVLGADYTTHVEYAPSGDDFNLNASYTNVATFSHEQLLGMSRNALLTIQTTGKNKVLVRFFNGTSFGSAHAVPKSGGGGPEWFGFNKDPGGVTHVLSETTHTSPIYALKEYSTTKGTKWSAPTNLGNAINSNTFNAALDSNGSGLVLGTDAKAIGYPVLAHQSVTFSLSKSSVKSGKKVTGKGKGSAAASGRKIELQIEKSGKWYDVASTHEKASGSFKFKIKGTSIGSHKYRAVANDHAGYVEFGYSPARTLHVT